MRSIALCLLLVACGGTPPTPTPDAGPTTADAAEPITTHHFVVNAWTGPSSEPDGAVLYLDGERSQFQAVTEVRGEHAVRIETFSCLSRTVEVRLYCDGVGVASGHGLPPPEVVDSFVGVSREYVWRCP